MGAGKVGAVLGAALRAAEHAVVGVSAVSDASRERAESLLPGVPILEVQDIVERAELVLLAVPDDALPGLVEGLAKLGAWQPGQLVAHTSGRFGVGVLHPVRAAGAVPLALHPAMTFTGMSLDLTRLLDCTFGVTADAAMLPIAQAWWWRWARNRWPSRKRTGPSTTLPWPMVPTTWSPSWRRPHSCCAR